LKATISLCLARQFSFFGVKGKNGEVARLPFNKTFICKIIKRCVRESFPNSELDELMFQNVISKWLNESKDSRKKM
jgi:hypothetical protein